MKPIKSEYKHICFKIQNFDVDKGVLDRLRTVYSCESYDGEILGFVLYQEEWEEWGFSTVENIILPKECLLNVVDYIRQLNNIEKGG